MKSCKIISLILTVMLSLILSMTAVLAAEEPVLSGSCGADITYSLSADGVLTVSGNGIIAGRVPSEPLIPAEHAASVTSLVFSEGITTIGTAAFLNLTAVTEVTIPASVISIDDYAIGFTYADDTYTPIPDFKLIAPEDSIAKDYAQRYEFAFEALVVAPPLPSGPCGEKATWELSEDGVLTICGEGAIDHYDAALAPWMTLEDIDIEIKELIIEEGITAIGCNAFENMDIHSVELPSTLLEISDNAFRSCTSLTSVTIPGTVNIVSSGAFTGCLRLTVLTLREGVSVIADSAFAMTAITELSLPESLSYLGDSAFLNCQALTKVNAPGVNEIGSRTFYGCSGLRTVSSLNVLNVIGDSAFESCSLLKTFDFTAPLISIGSRAFYGCNALVTVSLPHTLEQLGSYAFRNCAALKEISTGNGLTEIPEGAFQNCGKLYIVNIGTSVETIGERAFVSCPVLRSLEIPSNVHYIFPKAIGYHYYEAVGAQVNGTYAAYTDFVLHIRALSPSAAENYANDNGFNFTSLGVVEDDSGVLTETITWSINVPNGVLMLNGEGDLPDYPSFESTPWQLYRDYITTVILGNGITSVGNNSFEGCSNLYELSMFPTMTSIGDYAFSGTAIVNLIIPNGVTEIGNGAFDGCSALYTVSLPNSLRSIGQYAFRGPNTVRSMYVPASVSFIGANAIGYTQHNIPIPTFQIKGVKGSAAHTYATQSGLTFHEDGFIEIRDNASGASISVLGKESDRFTLSFARLGSTLEPDVMLSNSEYALVYRLMLLQGEETITPEGTITIRLPIPDNVNPLAVRLFAYTENGQFTEIAFTVTNGCFLFTHHTLGRFVISNADLTTLRTITIKYLYANGTEAHAPFTIRATVGSDYRFTALNLDDYTPDKRSFAGTVADSDIVLTFTYTEIAVTTEEDPGIITTEPVQVDPEDSKTLIVILIIVLCLALIAAVLLLVFINMKKKRRRQELLASRRVSSNDKFADTIVVPDAPTQEIDIQSLFADEPEEDTDAIVRQLKSKDPKSTTTPKKPRRKP
ncbi:MAG: hypothetical protein E7618_08125 [Ruminococcaceae bacterium]|nr:hypothetical protein [Oscillospiraceae bacterium]